MTATIEDVKELLRRGLDPRNTVNRLGTMLADLKPASKAAPVAEAPKPVREVKKKARR